MLVDLQSQCQFDVSVHVCSLALLQSYVSISHLHPCFAITSLMLIACECLLLHALVVVFWHIPYNSYRTTISFLCHCSCEWRYGAFRFQRFPHTNVATLLRCPFLRSLLREYKRFTMMSCFYGFPTRMEVFHNNTMFVCSSHGGFKCFIISVASSHGGDQLQSQRHHFVVCRSSYAKGDIIQCSCFDDVRMRM